MAYRQKKTAGAGGSASGHVKIGFYCPLSGDGLIDRSA